MGEVAGKFDNQHLSKLKNTSEITDVVIKAKSFKQASVLFAEYISQLSCSLLFQGKYDPSLVDNSEIIFSALPKEVAEMCTHFDGKQGCPLVQIALRSGRSFDALDLYLEGFDEFFTMRYFKALKKLGYKHIEVVPIFTNDNVFVFFIGINSSETYYLMNDALPMAISQFIAASFVKFPQDAVQPIPSDESARITNREIECLTWTALGKTSFEISAILDLSEHTVNAYLASASAKLNATNRVQAVVKAIEAHVINL